MKSNNTLLHYKKEFHLHFSMEGGPKHGSSKPDWKCSCGKLNPYSANKCSCGKDKV